MKIPNIKRYKIMPLAFATLFSTGILATDQAMAAPSCDNKTATVYVKNEIIVGGLLNAQKYQGYLYGTADDDVIVGTKNSDNIPDFVGNDIILGLAGSDTICASFGNDLVYAGEARVTTPSKGAMVSTFSTVKLVMTSYMEEGITI